MTAIASTPDRGFFSRLFDFSFSTFVTTSIVKALFIFGLLVDGLFCIGVVVGFGQIGGGYVALGLFVALLLFFVWAIWIRVFLETVIVFFRIAENTAITANALGNGGNPGSGGFLAPPPAVSPLPLPPTPALPSRPPAASARGRITLLDAGRPQPERSLRAGEALVAGSGGNCNIVFVDPRVHAQHVRIELTNGGWRVSDLSWTNPPTIVTPDRSLAMPNGGSETVALGEVRIGDSVIGLHATSSDPFATQS